MELLAVELRCISVLYVIESKKEGREKGREGGER